MKRREFTHGVLSAAVLSARASPAFAQSGLPLEQMNIFFSFPAES